MEVRAPVPAQSSAPIEVVSPQKDISMLDSKNPSVVSVTLVGAGGCGINLVRPFLTSKQLTKALYFDTSMTNTRNGEKCNIVTSGSGSGSNRSQNARDIERELPQMTDEDMALGDVAIICFSLSGGSGSVIGPLLLREYSKRKTRVIGVAVADSSYSVGAQNTLNTLKTLSSISKNAGLYLPLIVLSNDAADRRSVNDAATVLINDLIDLLTVPVYEVDRQDRLNWIDPTNAASQIQPGIKLMNFTGHPKIDETKIVFGTESAEMVDSILILQSEDAAGPTTLPPARLKKTGFYYEKARQVVGRVTSDITSIERIIDHVERSQHQDKAQKHSTVDRLENASGSDDLIL